MISYLLIIFTSLLIALVAIYMMNRDYPQDVEAFANTGTSPSNIQMNLGSGSLTASTVNATTVNATGGTTTVKNLKVNEDITVEGKINIGALGGNSEFSLTSNANKHGHTGLPNGMRMAYGTIGPDTYDSDSARTITFSKSFSKIPVISITRHGADLKSPLGISAKTKTGFSVDREGGSDESSLDYIAIGFA